MQEADDKAGGKDIEWMDRERGPFPVTVWRPCLPAAVDTASARDLENEHDVSLGLVAIDDPHRTDAMRAVPPERPGQGLAGIGLLTQSLECLVDAAEEGSIVTREPEVTGLCALRKPNARHESALP